MSERAATRRRKSSSKLKKPVPVTRKATFVGGWDLLPNVADTKMLGSVNPVTRTELNDATLIKGGPTVYFKPGPFTAQYAIASTRLARFLGMESVISHNAFAHISGQDGYVSGQVLGVPLRTLEHAEETEIPDQYKPRSGGPPRPEDYASWLDSAGSGVVERDGKYFKLTAMVYNHVDFKDPRIQKGLADLQIFDAICGQIDRHGGNIFVDPGTGQVTGIDDDLSMKDDGRSVARPFDKYPGLPPLVDRTTADRILRMRPENLPKYLGHQENDGRDLKPQEIRAAEKRLSEVQAYLRTLEGTDAIVDTWNDGTYNRLMADSDKTYLGRAQADLQVALAGNTIDGYPAKTGPLLSPPPALAWAPARPTVGGGQQNASNLPTSPRPPAIVGTRPRPGVQRLREEQLRDQQRDDQRLIDQQSIDQFDAFPALPTTPRGAVSPSSSSARAATSRLASARPRPVPVEKEVSPRPPVDDSSDSSSEPEDTITTTEDDMIEGAKPPVSPSRNATLDDIERELRVINALLQDLTGSTLADRTEKTRDDGSTKDE